VDLIIVLPLHKTVMLSLGGTV